MRAWEITSDGVSRTLIPLSSQVIGDGLSLAFSPRGDVLAVETAAVRSGRGGFPRGERSPEIAGSTGRLGHLAVSPDGQRLLQVAWNGRRHSPGRAILWRFGQDRGTQSIPGLFQQAGGFLPDGRLVLIDENGDVVVHDGATLERRMAFQRPIGGNGRASMWMFTTLAIAPDGKRVAAGSDDGPLACVWTTDDGRLARTILREFDEKVRAVSFSADGRSL